MKARFSKDILNFILYFLLVILLLYTIGAPIALIVQSVHAPSIISLINMITNLIYTSMYLIVVICLIRIVGSTLASPFIQENVKRFRIMGYCLVINTVFECILGYNAALTSGVTVISTDNGGITPPMIICLLSALMCFVMGEIFDKAIKIKNESDLTI